MRVLFHTLRSYEKFGGRAPESDVCLTDLVELFRNPLIQAFPFASRRDKNLSVQTGRQKTH